MQLTSRLLTLLDRLSSPATVHAHCDLPCGVYDPAQARIEAESVKAIMEKFNASNDEVFKERALFIKEERAELVKHHLWVLWTDYFKPEHLEKHPELHSLLDRNQDRRRVQEDHRRRRRPEAAGPDRRDRSDLLGDEEGLSGTPGGRRENSQRSPARDGWQHRDLVAVADGRLTACRVSVDPDRADGDDGRKARPVALGGSVQDLTDGKAVDTGLAGAGTFACLGEETKPGQAVRSRPERSASSASRARHSAVPGVTSRAGRRRSHGHRLRRTRSSPRPSAAAPVPHPRARPRRDRARRDSLLERPRACLRSYRKLAP